MKENQELIALLQRVVASISVGALLPNDYLRQLDCDKLLDARDNDEIFVARWKQAYQEVEREWVSATIPTQCRELIETIRHDAFMAVTSTTNHHEIASYISDDFALICQAKILGFEDDLINKLWACYKRRQFPSSPLPEA